MKVVIQGLIAVAFLSAGVGLGVFADNQYHKSNTEIVAAFAKENGCRDLGAPDKNHPLTPYVAKGFDCGGAVIIVTK